MKIPKIETIDSCPVCRSEYKCFWSKGKDLLTQSSTQIFEYSKCNVCDVVYMNRRPIESDIGFFYTNDYHPYQSNASKKRLISYGFLSRLKLFINIFRIKNKLQRETDRVYKALGNNDVFVDFGCGAGKHLDLMRKRKCKTIGVDFSSIAISQVSKNGHEGYLVNDFFENVSNSSVQLVRMNHVVEHLYHSQEVLLKIGEKIKKGGHLHIAVPNPIGISSILFRRNWHGLDCPRHVILYPSKTLVSVLRDAGFYNFIILQETISKDFVRSLGYFFAEYGLIKLDKVNDLMHSTLCKMILFVPLLIISKFGFGDRYHIFCIKK
jgi:2-polyprenyl-3-methyl-5-hydroxy-6-metoxy-1,4-benzoquinol methylase